MIYINPYKQMVSWKYEFETLLDEISEEKLKMVVYNEETIWTFDNDQNEVVYL